MRRTTHENTFTFRASGVLAAAILRHAEKRGMTISELVRDAVREKVGLH